MDVSSLNSGADIIAAQSAGRSHGAGQEEVVAKLQTQPAEAANDRQEEPAKKNASPGVGQIVDRTV